MKDKKTNLTNKTDPNTVIFLDKNILKNPLLSYQGFSTYITLRKIQTKNPMQIVSTDYLYYNFINKDFQAFSEDKHNSFSTVSRANKSFFKQGLLELINLNIIQTIQPKANTAQDYFILDLSNIFIEPKDGNFFTLSFDDLFVIAHLKNNLSAASKILKYYCIIISHYPKNKHCTALFAKDLQQEINVDIVTVRTYNKLLQDAKILYIHKNNTFYNTQTQEMEHLPSTYGSYKFKQEIEEFNKTMIDKITFNKSKFKQTQLTKGNKNRSICLKYRHFCEDNDKYSPTEVFELYKQIIARNNNVINSPKNKNSSLIKSLEPFDNYFKPYNIIAEIKNIDLNSVVSTLSKKEIKINDLNSVGELFGLEVIPDLIDYFKFANVTFNLVKSPLMTKLPKTKTKLNSENNTNDSQDSQENNSTEQNSQITPIFNFPKTHAKN